MNDDPSALDADDVEGLRRELAEVRARLDLVEPAIIATSRLGVAVVAWAQTIDPRFEAVASASIAGDDAEGT